MRPTSLKSKSNEKYTHKSNFLSCAITIKFACNFLSNGDAILPSRVKQE